MVMPKLEWTKQSQRYVILAFTVEAAVYLGVHAFQIAHGFTHPLFLWLGLFAAGVAITLYCYGRQIVFPKRPASKAKILLALVLAFLISWPAFRESAFTNWPNDYLHIRAWMFWTGSFTGCALLLLSCFSTVKRG